METRASVQSHIGKHFEEIALKTLALELEDLTSDTEMFGDDASNDGTRDAGSIDDDTESTRPRVMESKKAKEATSVYSEEVKHDVTEQSIPREQSCVDMSKTLPYVLDILTTDTRIPKRILGEYLSEIFPNVNPLPSFRVSDWKP